jgi:hypothetical protein
MTVTKRRLDGKEGGRLSASAKTIIALAESAAEMDEISRTECDNIVRVFRPSTQPVDLTSRQAGDSVCEIQEAAVRLKVTPRTVHRLCSENVLRRACLPNRSRSIGILRSSLDRLLANCGTDGKP